MVREPVSTTAGFSAPLDACSGIFVILAEELNKR